MVIHGISWGALRDEWITRRIIRTIAVELDDRTVWRMWHKIENLYETEIYLQE